MLGYHKIAEQIGEYGIFGEVKLSCNELYFDKKIFITNNSKTDNYYIGVQFGVAYFLEHSKYSGLSIEILNIEGNEVDTTSMVIAYLTVMALCNGFNMQLRQMPSFNNNIKLFEFPK